MALNTIAILSPGDMGHAVGASLREHGHDVITLLAGRSEVTRGLARDAGMRDTDSLEAMVSEADLVLSILVPSEAAGVARQVADAVRVAGSNTLFADCNATSPQTAREMDAAIAGAGGRFIDGSIIGGPPGGGGTPRFYVSGEHAGIMSELDGKGISVRQMGAEIGRASAIKMCYAAGTKGTSALHAALLVAAEALGISDELGAELASSQPEAYERMRARISGIPAKAGRWVGEMEQIAETFAAVGVTPYFHKGAAEVFDLMSQANVAQTASDEQAFGNPSESIIRAVVEALQSRRSQ